MKYELTPIEKEQLNSGELISLAAYNAESAALCQYVAEYNGIKYRSVLSESPTGMQIFIFFFYPETLYKAYRLGSMLEREDLYVEECDKLVKNVWAERFKAIQNG